MVVSNSLTKSNDNNCWLYHSISMIIDSLLILSDITNRLLSRINNDEWYVIG